MGCGGEVDEARLASCRGRFWDGLRGSPHEGALVQACEWGRESGITLELLLAHMQS